MKVVSEHLLWNAFNFVCWLMSKKYKVKEKRENGHHYVIFSEFM